jgi:hypothetical protein
MQRVREKFDLSCPESAMIIIQGVTSGGKIFRPSDWAERLTGVMSTLTDDNRLSYSPYLKPIARDGVKCVLLSKRLLEEAPCAYAFLLGFARDNDLRVVEADIPRVKADPCRPDERFALGVTVG